MSVDSVVPKQTTVENGSKTNTGCLDEEITEAKATPTKNKPWFRVLVKMISVALITVANTARLMFLVLGYIFPMIFNDMCMISFGKRKIDNKVLTFLLIYSNQPLKD